MSATTVIPAIVPAPPRPGGSPAEGACDAAAFVALLAGLLPAAAPSPLAGSPAVTGVPAPAAEANAPLTVRGAEGCAQAARRQSIGEGTGGPAGRPALADAAAAVSGVASGGPVARPSTDPNPGRTEPIGAAVAAAPGEPIGAPPAPPVPALPAIGPAPEAAMPAPPGRPASGRVARPVPQGPAIAPRASAADPSPASAIASERTGAPLTAGTPVVPAERRAAHLQPVPRIIPDEATAPVPAAPSPPTPAVADGAAPSDAASPAVAPSAAAVQDPGTPGAIMDADTPRSMTPDTTPAPSRARIMPPADPDRQPAAVTASRSADPASSSDPAPADPSVVEESARALSPDPSGEPRSPATAPAAAPTDVPEPTADRGPAPQLSVAGASEAEGAGDAPAEPRAGRAVRDRDDAGGRWDALGPVVAHRASGPAAVAEPTAAVGAAAAQSPAPAHVPGAAPAHAAPVVRVHLPELPVPAEAVDVHHVRLEVDPPELGRCELELTLREGAVRAVLVAERADTVVALREVEGQVRAALADRNLQMTEFDVRHGGGGDAGGAPRQDTGAQPSPPTPRLVPMTEPKAQAAPPRTSDAARRVDLFA